MSLRSGAALRLVNGKRATPHLSGNQLAKIQLAVRRYIDDDITGWLFAERRLVFSENGAP